jgi:hypothetical protein
MERLDLSLSGQ